MDQYQENEGSSLHSKGSVKDSLIRLQDTYSIKAQEDLEKLELAHCFIIAKTNLFSHCSRVRY
jgi:hypothetical protein